MRPMHVLPAFCASILAFSAAAAAAAVEFTEVFPVDDCSFSSTGRNPFFSLEPGHRLVLEGDDQGETVRVQITVLDARKTIRFESEEGETLSVRARIVEEREWVGGELIEVSRNFYARCVQTNDIYYFGEDVDIYDDGEIVSHDGAWKAGVDGAQPGIIMPGSFLLGARYYQELAPEIALDRAEHVRMNFQSDVPAGVLDECVEIVETTPLEPGSESRKTYCEGVGLVKDGTVALVRVKGDDDEDDEDVTARPPKRR